MPPLVFSRDCLMPPRSSKPAGETRVRSARLSQGVEGDGRCLVKLGIGISRPLGSCLLPGDCTLPRSKHRTAARRLPSQSKLGTLVPPPKRESPQPPKRDHPHNRRKKPTPHLQSPQRPVL